MRRILGLAVFLFTSIYSWAQSFDEAKMRYIEQFKYWAMDEQVRTGVPAAISLAQGILETGSGKSELCKEANNHFGIKCKKEWTGDTYLHDDDRRHECFRKYKSAKDSYIDHSNFLATRSHYSFLFKLDPTDYKGWCNGLRKAGYATNPKYATRLIDLIEDYNLQQYTYEAIEIANENSLAKEVIPEKDKVVENKEVEVVKVEPATSKISQEAQRSIKRKIIYDKLMTKNGRQGFWARKGDYLLPEAVQYNIRYAKLLAINDLADEPLPSDMFIYLKRKAKKGDRQFHIVKPGEDMHSISQNTGVQLKYLYIYNNLYDNEEPAVGEKIYLQGRTSYTPRLRGQKTQKQDEAIVQKSNEAERLERENLIKEQEQKEAERLAKVKELEEKIRKSKEAAKKLEEEQAAARAEQQRKAREEAALARERAKKETDNRVIVRQEKPNAQITKIDVVKGDAQILDLEKAKRTEQLMGDGTKEITRLHNEKLQAAKRQRVIAAPGQQDAEILNKEKAAKTKSKNKQSNRRNYNEKNVTDEVKDLKKKFDSLIYDDE